MKEEDKGTSEYGVDDDDDEKEEKEEEEEEYDGGDCIDDSHNENYKRIPRFKSQTTSLSPPHPQTCPPFTPSLPLIDPFNL